MKRLLIAMLALMLCLAPAAMAENWYDDYDCDDFELLTIDYCAESVSLRDKPRVSGDVLATVPKGERVILLERADRNSDFIRVNFRGVEGYILEGYTEAAPTALRVTDCDEWASLREKPEQDAERIGRIPQGRMLYSGRYADGFASTAMMNVGYGYVSLEHLARADEGEGCVRYVANCGSAAKLYRYATTRSDVIGTIPAGEAVRCLSLNNANMVYVWSQDNVRGFLPAEHLDVVPAGNRIVRATLTIPSDGEDSVQTITDGAMLAELNDLLAMAEPGEVGKCPMVSLLKIELDDGTALEFIYPTDGCSSLVGTDSRVYCIPSKVNDHFWKLFDFPM